MASLMLSLVIVFHFGVIPGRESSNFPLADCSSRDMDILALLFDNGNANNKNYQLQSSSNFIKHVLGTSNHETTPRVLHADVYDKFSSHNPNVNVSAWHFLPSDEIPIYGNESIQGSNPPYTTLQKILEIKVTFVEHLFSEMSGVRENATHLAIIFLDGSRFSKDKSRNSLQTVEQQNSTTKVFVVLIGGDHGNQTVYLGDALLVSDYIQEASIHILSLAVCNQCQQGWVLFNHSKSSDYLSCYKIVDETKLISSIDAMGICYKSGGYLAAIETQEEYAFLQKLVFSFLELLVRVDKVICHRTRSMPVVYVGLLKDSTGLLNQLHWALRFPTRFRPFTFGTYLRFKIHESYSGLCGIWLFIWRKICEKSYESAWEDVSCITRKTSIGLCEISLPRRHEEMSMIRISPSSKESFSKAVKKTQPVKVGDNTVFDSQVMIFGSNIVSVSANIANTGFQKFLKETGLEFPIFDCGENSGYPRHISYVFVCDYIDHCMNRRDEMYCNREHVATKVECSGIYCCDGSCLPVELVNDYTIDCKMCEDVTDKDDESDIRNKFKLSNKTCALVCNDGTTCVEYSMLNDGRPDCHGLEGPIDETIGKLNASNKCSTLLFVKVWSPRCVYVKNPNDAIIGCRDMSHLAGCTHFQCTEGYVKCPNAYCIPQHYVLDGKTDCPTGEDEYNYNVGSCSGNFACWNSEICLHPDQVCDRRPDCPHGDDEVDCNVGCAGGFRCISGTITLSDYNRSIPLRNNQFINAKTRYIDLSGVDLSLVSQLLIGDKEYVQFIKWANCKIRNLFHMFSLTPSRIDNLDISNNLIQTFSGSDITFRALDNIRHLNLSYNRELVIVEYLQFKILETFDLSYTGISYLHETFMAGLPAMKNLNLSFTFISHFHKTLFSSNIPLQTLDLRGTRFDNFYSELFNGLIINQHLYTDNFEMCCPQIRGVNIPSYACHTPDNAICSCFDLVGSDVQRVILWVVAVLAVSGNIAVIAYRVIWDRSVIRTGYGLFVTNLGISDCIMGLYLFIIAGSDYYYRGNYVLFDKTWRESVGCRLAGFLATLSLESSTLFCFLITLDRFLVMKFPFGQVQFSKRNKMLVVLLSWIIGFVLALIPVVFNFQTYSSSPMCLDLPLTPNRLRGWEYSFGVYIVHNFVMFLIIAYGQISIFRAMSENRISSSASSTSSRRPEDIVVAKQLFLVALSTFLCWFPVGIMGFTSLAEEEISNDVYSWVTVVVLPINAAANPLLYTIPALLAKWENFKHGNKRTRTT